MQFKYYCAGAYQQLSDLLSTDDLEKHYMESIASKEPSLWYPELVNGQEQMRFSLRLLRIYDKVVGSSEPKAGNELNIFN